MHGHKHRSVLEMSCPRRRPSGFTLIELMVTISIVAIAMAIAVPSMTTFMRNAELTSFANSLVSAINVARGEAMKRGMNAMAVPTDGSNWSSGWVVFVDIDRSQAYETASDFTSLNQPAPPSYLTITASSGSTAAASPPYIMFDASGYSKTKSGGFGALTFEIKRNDVTGTDA